MHGDQGGKSPYPLELFPECWIKCNNLHSSTLKPTVIYISPHSSFFHLLLYVFHSKYIKSFHSSHLYSVECKKKKILKQSKRPSEIVGFAFLNILTLIRLKNPNSMYTKWSVWLFRVAIVRSVRIQECIQVTLMLMWARKKKYLLSSNILEIKGIWCIPDSNVPKEQLQSSCTCREVIFERLVIHNNLLFICY